MPSGYKNGPKALVSPTNSQHPSPTSQYSTLPHPRASSSKSAPRPRNKSHQRTFMSDSDSDLTPASSDDEEDDGYESLVTPRKGAHKGRPSVAGGGTGSVQKSATKKAVPKKGKNPQAKKKSHSTKEVNTKTTTGPAGRDKKRAIKLEDSEIRRARDAKFDMDQDLGGRATPTQSTSQHRWAPLEDDASSYADDESDHGITDEEHTIAGIPEAFIGQEIEDLAYGAGDMDAEMAFWGGAEDGSEDEDEEMYIDQLSGSEADRQSQSSVSIRDSDSSTDDETDDDDALDEFGFPVASAPHLPLELAENGAEDPGLILMENWDGQFVLVQPRVERSRSRHRGERGSRTGASTNGSVISGTELQNLTIDADAADREFDSDSSSWSGMSDEDDGGDTTDSMAEEDMPMLDSPALNEMMEHQMAEVVLKMAADGGDISGIVLPEAVASAPGPAITLTEATSDCTPALSTASSSGPLEPSTLPTTPSSGEPTPSEMPAPSNVPMMGTFLPPTGDPAQHAVIDGSGLTTKSPFTHRRRSRRNRDAASLASSKEDKERKRKSHSDIFSPSAMSPSTPKPNGTAKSKKLRYSSIPGHPRYVAALRAAEALMPEEDRNTTTDDDEDGFHLEDMLEEGVLVDGAGEGLEGEPVEAEHLRHMLRFDRVGVSTYLRRNFGTPNAAAAVEPRASFSLGVGSAYPSPGNARLDDTLVGPMGGRMLMSPVLGPVEEGRGRSGRKKDKKKRKQSAMPELAI